MSGEELLASYLKRIEAFRRDMERMGVPVTVTVSLGKRVRKPPEKGG